MGDTMPHHVETTAEINVDPDSLWRKVGSFQGVGSWHPMVRTVEGMGEQPGALRTAVSKDGQKQVEQLEEVDPERRFYRYAMVSSAMPVRNYVAEFGVHSNSTGKTPSSGTVSSRSRPAMKEKRKTPSASF